VGETGVKSQIICEYSAAAEGDSERSGQTGTPIADEDLAHVSPLLHRHVIPNRTYHFPRAIEGGKLVVEYATVCFRSQRILGLYPLQARKACVQ
jgi:hypothetical protein